MIKNLFSILLLFLTDKSEPHKSPQPYSIIGITVAIVIVIVVVVIVLYRFGKIDKCSDGKLPVDTMRL